MKLNKWCEFVEKKIGGAFAKYGRFVSCHAWKIMIMTIIVNGALGIGMIKLQKDIDPRNLYLPQGTEARKDRARVDDIFPNLSGSNFNPLTVSIVDGLYARVIIRSTAGNLLNRTVLEEVKRMTDFIKRIEAKDGIGTAIKRYTVEVINLSLRYCHYDSVDEELNATIYGDITLIEATLVLMITYACVASLSYRLTDQVGQRMWLGFGGILAAGLAIVSSFGLCAACGVDFVSTVGIVPFLIIGIGIDDMFILLSGLSEAQTRHSVEDKLAETLRISGVGITITSVTDLIAFLAGAGSSFIAVRNFCIYTVFKEV
ncbi:protein patched homolog 1-like [Ruditapes philippinarum]|uniref:protein patched homolog 1-like n=1 Tax=Ruditapes philippinarum TaxID=129788 RepID=UPI00295AC9F1|nr:protein patched homolog 1-like [Ruditapes philippinarum]